MHKRVAVDDLRTGMHIVELCGSWIDHPFWRSRFLLERDEDIQRLRESDVREVVIDTDKGLDVAQRDAHKGQSAAHDAATGAGAALDAVRPARTGAERIPFDQELERAARLYRSARPQVMSMFKEARLGKAIDAERAAALVEEIGASVTRNPDAFISLARLKNSWNPGGLRSS